MRFITSLLGLLLTLSAYPQSFGRITNDRFYTCTDGTPIYSQGGGIFRFTDPATGRERFYWYGAFYREA